MARKTTSRHNWRHAAARYISALLLTVYLTIDEREVLADIDYCKACPNSSLMECDEACRCAYGPKNNTAAGTAGNLNSAAGIGSDVLSGLDGLITMLDLYFKDKNFLNALQGVQKGLDGKLIKAPGVIAHPIVTCFQGVPGGIDVLMSLYQNGTALSTDTISQFVPTLCAVMPCLGAIKAWPWMEALNLACSAGDLGARWIKCAGWKQACAAATANNCWGVQKIDTICDRVARQGRTVGALTLECGKLFCNPNSITWGHCVKSNWGAANCIRNNWDRCFTVGGVDITIPKAEPRD